MGSKRTIVRLVLASALVAFVLSIASSSGATSIPVRTGSSYGPSDGGFGSCESAILNFLNGSGPEACEGFNSGTFTINGTIYNGGQFDFLNGVGTQFGILDIIVIGDNPSDPNNSTVSLTLANFAAPTGVFLCDGGTGAQAATAVTDSKGNTVNGLPCTSNSLNSGTVSSADFSDAGLTAAFTFTGATFTTTGTPFVLFTSDGNILNATFAPGASTVPTPTSEPASLILVGTGLAALIGIKRRKR